MYNTLLKWLAMPIVRVLLVLIATTYVVFGPFLAYKWGYKGGFADGKTDMAEQYAAAYELEKAKVDTLNTELDKALADLEAEKKNIKERVVTRWKTVKELVDANPDFANVVRPPELDALRVRELREINQTLGSPSD